MAYGIDASVEMSLVEIGHADLEALEGANMGDAAAHLAGTDDADALDHDGYL